jgi:hypothetical protein
MDQLDKTHRLGISVIVLCCSLIFAVGVGFLFYRSDSPPISFRVLGDPRPLAGASTAFRISAWNSKLRSTLPVQVSRATLRSPAGAAGVEGQIQPSLPELGTLLRFSLLDLPPGEALLELELATEGQDPRLLSLPLRLMDAGLRPDRWLRAAQAHELALEDRPLWLRPPGGVILGDRSSPVLLRLLEAAPKETLYWSLDESAPQALPLEQGLGLLKLEINRPLHQLRLAFDPGLANAAQIGLAPLGVTALELSSPGVSAAPDAKLSLTVISQALAPTLACAHWRDGRLLDSFDLDTSSGTARRTLPASQAGVHRVACADRLGSQDPWTGEAFFLVAQDDPRDLGRELARLLKEPLLEEGSSGPAEAWLTWLVTMLETRAPGLELLADTLPGDTLAQRSSFGRFRGFLTLALGLLGLGLLGFGVWVVLAQHRSLLRSPGEGALDPDSPEALEANLGRRQALLPFFMVLLAALLNLAAMVYLFLRIL